jgi:hypothetical protein
MNNFFETNISLLRKTNPESAALAGSAVLNGITPVPSKNGDMVPEVSVNGKKILLHSRFDPRVEADRFCADAVKGSFSFYAVAGFGYGYHVERIMETMPSDGTILVIEKDASIIRSAAENRDLSAVFGDPRFILLVNPTEDDIAVRMKGRSSRNSVFIMHRGSGQVNGDYYTNAVRVAKSYISSKDANIATLAKFEKLWSSNITRNAGVFLSSPPVSAFFNSLQGIPAIVVCAGPSLSRSIPFIRRSLDSAVVIAVDTAYFILRRHGIEPHFCVCADPQVVNARYFEGDTPSRTILVADPCIHPSVYRFFNGRVLSAGIPFDMMKWIEEVSGEKGELAHGGSVSTGAFDLARRLGSSPIVLAGQDLSFSSGLAHARGSYLDEQVHNRVTRLYNAQMMNRFQLSALPPLYVKSIDGGKVRTNSKMIIFMNWFERQAASNVLNATAEGAFMNGYVHKKDSEITFAENRTIGQLIDKIYADAAPRDSDAQIAELKSRVSSMESSAAELEKVLSRAMDLSDELCTLTRTSPDAGGKIRYVLGKLGEIDARIEQATGAKDMIGLSVQRVIHTVTEGYDPGDEAISEQHGVALRSRFLYRGLHEGCSSSLKYLSKMKTLLK